MSEAAKLLKMKLLISIVLISWLSLMDCCVCNNEPSHPQDKICESDYVIVVNIVKLHFDTYHTYIRFKIEKNLKINNATKYYIQEQSMHKLNLSKDCSPKFYENQTYVIAGKFDLVNRTQINFNRCDYVKLISELDSEELYGITGNYDRGCSCRIRFCSPHCFYHAVNECRWSVGIMYEINRYTCLPITQPNCVWTRNGKEARDFYLENSHVDTNRLDFADSNGQHHHHVITHDIFNSRHQNIYHESKAIRHNRPVRNDLTPYHNDYFGMNSLELDNNIIRYNRKK